jgi:hypothetical protein
MKPILIISPNTSPYFFLKENPMAKTSCPISRAEFKEKAKALPLVINNVPLQAEVKEFSTGSFGWSFNGKMAVVVGETSASVQINVNLTVVGSKELPK